MTTIYIKKFIIYIESNLYQKVWFNFTAWISRNFVWTWRLENFGKIIIESKRTTIKTNEQAIYGHYVTAFNESPTKTVDIVEQVQAEIQKQQNI